jgi:intergrase/recombinase
LIWYAPAEVKIIFAFEKVSDARYRMLFKLLAFSGIRLRETLYLLNHFDTERVIVYKKIAKYPLSLKRGTKRGFYAYRGCPASAFDTKNFASFWI